MLRRWLILASLMASLGAAGCAEKIAALFIPLPAVAYDSGPELDDINWSSSGDASLQLTMQSVTPGHGPLTGGTSVILSGSGFNLQNRIFFDEIQIGDAQKKLLSPLAWRVITPPHSPGPVRVRVERGDEAASRDQAFTYDPVYFDPANGPTTGGTRVIVNGVGTNFNPQMTLLLGGKPLTEVEVVSPTQLKAVTPAGQEGAADFSWEESGVVKKVGSAFTYYLSVNQKNGGLGGGALAGTLTVNVLDYVTRKPLADVKIIVEGPSGQRRFATTSTLGSAVFSSSNLVGRVSLTAAKAGYEATSLINFDARDATIFLVPQPPPDPEIGPLPPGIQQSLAKGYLMFGGSTGVGSSSWNSVPEPGAGERKRAYVFVTYPSVFWGAQWPGANATIDFAPTGATAWPYQVDARPGLIAVYALAGLYTEATQKFVPYVLGVTRGLVTSPGQVINANVIMNIPLDRQVIVECTNLPGPIGAHRFLLGIDLGADGLILPMVQEFTGTGLARRKTFAKLPRFNHQALLDATFTAQVIFNGESATGLPYSQAIARQVMPDAQGKIVVDNLLGFPVAEAPLANEQFIGHSLAWSYNLGAPSMAVTTLHSLDNVPLWRIISRGEVRQVVLPDPTLLGFNAWPSGKIVWTQTLVHIPNFNFDQYNYSLLNNTYWDRWSYEEIPLVVP